MTDIGIILTGIIAVACFLFGRGEWLRHVLLMSWLVTLSESLGGVSRDLTVLTMAVLDLTVAGVALARVTHDPTRRDAQVVGGLSMALMPAHFVISASLGNVNWTLYASACNLVFILQCLTAGGWLDGMGRGITGFVDRFSPVRSLRGRR